MYSSQERGSPRNTLDQYALHDLLHSEEPLQPSLPIPIGYDRFSRQQDMGPLYMHEEEKITAAELANIEQQQQRMGPLQPPVQQHNMDQKRLLEHHVQQGVQEHVIKQVEQQQRQRAAAQFRQHQHQQMQQQQQQQQARMNHQQMMAMEQQKRMSGGMMYPSMQPQPKVCVHLCVCMFVHVLLSVSVYTSVCTFECVCFIYVVVAIVQLFMYMNLASDG